MTDITKGDLLEVIDSLPPLIKKDKRRIAQMILPDIQKWADGTGSVIGKTTDGRLEVILSIRRTEKYRNEVFRNNHS